MTRYKKQWEGELGYCNCLLVAMSRAGIASVELSSDAPVPDLEMLARAKPETVAWIHAQEFDYAALDPMTVIDALSQTAGLIPIHPGTATVEFGILDVDDVGGPFVQRYFSLHRTRSLATTSLRMQLEKAERSDGTKRPPPQYGGHGSS